MESRAGGGSSGLARPQTNQLEPTHPKLLGSRGSPVRTKLQTDITEPRRERLRSEAGKSKSTKSKVEVISPKWLEPMVGTTKPGRPQDCNDRPGPKCRESGTSVMESKQARLWGGGLNPECEKSKTKTKAPGQAKLLSSSGDAGCAKSGTGTEASERTED